MKKILLIDPSGYNSSNTLIRLNKIYIPKRTLPYLAALTPSQYEVTYIDERIDEIDFSASVDLVALTGKVSDIPRAIEIAARFKKNNIPSVIGGIGASILTAKIESADCFVSIILGEAELIWEQLLDDFENGKLEKQYDGGHSHTLANLPPARFDLLNTPKYQTIGGIPFHSIETSRGCPNDCSFCSVSRFFGKKMRYRPIEDVVAEIKKLKSRMVFFTDDNIGINPSRAIELFKALIPLRIFWLGQFESRAIKHPEMLSWAAKSGCIQSFVGIETQNPLNFDQINKPQNREYPAIEVIKSFKNAGIRTFIASVIIGLDYDTKESIKDMIQTIHKAGVDYMIPWILIPYPTTPLYESLKKENRILTDDYSLYNGVNVVFRPKLMTPAELEKVYWNVFRNYYSPYKAMYRLVKYKKNKRTLISSFALYYKAALKQHLYLYC